MMARQRLILLAIALAGVASHATLAFETIPNGFHDPRGGTPFTTAVSPGFPGLMWGGFKGTDENLGYNGSYFTLGGKTRLGEDWLDGRWLLEGRGHLSVDSGLFFGNFGLERVFSINKEIDVSGGVWYTVDDDRPEEFGHTFQQWGFSGKIKTHKWDFTGNIYAPVKETEFLVGSTTNGFVQHLILATDANGNKVNGYDVAFEGFDTELRFRPIDWSSMQGTVDVGMYYFRTDVEFLDNIIGARVRAGLRGWRGVQLYLELNHDNTFDTTVSAQVVVSSEIFGQYSHQGRDYEPTIRNDHIVRRHQVPRFARRPDGALYTVNHVNNTAPAGGDGTIERPFDRLQDAEGPAADVIFVDEGDGTSRNMDQGVVLDNGQQLLGDGVTHRLPTVGGGTFILCNDIDGQVPTISGNPAVTLAAGNANFAGNTVRGFRIVNSPVGILGSVPPMAGTIGRQAPLPFGGAALIEETQINGIGVGGSTGIRLLGAPATSSLLVRRNLTPGLGPNILNTRGVGVDVEGGAPMVTFEGDISITPAAVGAGPAIRVAGRTGGVVSFNGGNIATSGAGPGVLVEASATVMPGTADAGTLSVTSPLNVINSTSFGINIQDAATGTYTFTDGNIINPQNTAFRIAGGTPTVTYNGNISKSVAGGHLLAISGMGAGMHAITFQNGTLAANGASGGVSLTGNMGGIVTMSDVDIGQTTALTNIGVLISGATAGPTYKFRNLDIATMGATGFSATGAATVIVGDPTVRTTNGAGVVINNLTSQANMINFDTVTSTGGTAVTVIGSRGTYTFGDVSASGTAVGMTIGNNLGNMAMPAMPGTTLTVGSFTTTGITGTGLNFLGGDLSTANTYAFNGINITTSGVAGVVGVSIGRTVGGSASGATPGPTIAFNGAVNLSGAASAIGIVVDDSVAADGGVFPAGNFLNVLGAGGMGSVTNSAPMAAGTQFGTVLINGASVTY